MLRLLTLLFLLSFLACRQSPQEQAESVLEITDTPAQLQPSAAVPDWSASANIYEVNIRQITAAGTFNAFTDQRLEDIARLGVDILWLMPVYPISEKKRKGGLGSYYAVSDFRSANLEFGTSDDLQRLIDRAHELNLRVIFDFVPNHTGWDHVWLQNNPDWYTQDEDGNVVDPLNPETGESWGWTDVADLNHDNPDLREAMIGDLEYWLRDFKIDGYRMDVAHQVPTAFWEAAMPRLRAVNPDLFMLAEAQAPELRNQELFAADYGWDFHHLLNAVAKGEKSAEKIKEWYTNDQEKYQRGWHMNFITNHDENSWNGTVKERMGDNWAPAAILVSTLDGMPLIYGGQEAGLDKRLAFFEKDTIDFSDQSRYPFYTKLNNLKHRNQAIWNGHFGGRPIFIDYTGDQDKTLAFYRSTAGQTVMVFLNFSDEEQKMVLPAGGPKITDYKMLFSPQKGSIINGEVRLPAHGYVVISKE